MVLRTFLLALIIPSLLQARAITVAPVEGEVAAGTVELHGVGAGTFDPKIWQANTLHLLPDARHPLIEPRPGNARNIYAPSIVEIPGGWRIFYGAWDGV